jgi:hypothetical protein
MFPPKEELPVEIAHINCVKINLQMIIVLNLL